jgi:hypothetical protein
MIMKKTLMSVASAAVLALGFTANANTISVGDVTTAADGSGGLNWTYPIVFNNSQVLASEPSFFTIADFGLVRGGVLPVFSPGGSAWTGSQPLVGLTSVTLVANQPGAPFYDVQYVFSGSGTVQIPDGTYNLVLDSPLGSSGGQANYSSQDQTGAGGGSQGTTSVAARITLAPQGIQTPDGGATAMLLGAALFALGLIRRKLA